MARQKKTDYQYPYGLDGMRQANTCPYCGSQGGVSLEHQELSFDKTDTKLIIQNGFECMYCCDSWYQTIEVLLGEATSNTVELSS